MAQLNTDHYALLGVTPAASPAEITDAFRARLRGLHPDDDRFGQLVTAYIDLRRLHHHAGEGGDRAVSS